MSGQPDDYVPSPFHVGQRIQRRSCTSVRGVVVALTDEGFEYKLDSPESFGRGLSSDGGFVFCRSWYSDGGFDVEAEEYDI